MKRIYSKAFAIIALLMTLLFNTPNITSASFEYIIFIKNEVCTPCAATAIRMATPILVDSLSVDKSNIKYYTISESEKAVKILNKKTELKLINLPKDNPFFATLDEIPLTDLPFFCITNGDSIVYKQSQLTHNMLNKTDIEKIISSVAYSDNFQERKIVENDSIFIYDVLNVIHQDTIINIYDNAQGLAIRVNKNTGQIIEHIDLAKELDFLKFYYMTPDQDTAIWNANLRNYKKLVMPDNILTLERKDKFTALIQLFDPYELDTVNYEKKMAIWKRSANIVNYESGKCSVDRIEHTMDSLYYLRGITYFRDNLLVSYYQEKFFFDKDFTGIDTLIKIKKYNIKTKKYSDFYNVLNDNTINTKNLNYNETTMFENGNNLLFLQESKGKVMVYDRELTQISEYDIDKEVFKRCVSFCSGENAEVFLLCKRANGNYYLKVYDIRGKSNEIELKPELNKYNSLDLFSTKDNTMNILGRIKDEWFIITDKLNYKK